MLSKICYKIRYVSLIKKILVDSQLFLNLLYRENIYFLIILNIFPTFSLDKNSQEIFGIDLTIIKLIINTNI